MSLGTASWLILACPLAGTLVLGLGFKVWSARLAGAIGTLAIAAAFVFAIVAFFKLQDLPEDARHLTDSLWTYFSTGGVDVQMSVYVDPLSIFMALVVTGVSTLIHLYSTAYMRSDEGVVRYFAYLNFFVFSMLVLVLAGNFFLLIVGWAFVGAASYLLISFWYRRTTATKAGIKAFVINVFGDVGLVLGAFFIFKHTGTLDYAKTFAEAPNVFAPNDTDLVVGCLLLLVGAFAKSAQVPLHTWLPDAMEGPTPVSSLIHAATMVTAGVYLIARMHPLFQIATTAADVGVIVGMLTLLIAGTIGLVMTDLKRIIAYSTMSQIGYMIMGVSAAAYVGGLFHLMTHAFFKALLFMAAGSVIGAMGGAQSIEKMRGLRKAMPFTFMCFIVGGLALTAVVPFSGFFSKDELLFQVGERGGWYYVPYAAGYIGAFLTGIYTWRMIFRVFWGDPCPEAQELEAGHLYHPHEATNPANGEVEDQEVGFPGPEHVVAERSIAMKVAMGALAVLATIGGVVGIPHVTDWLDTFLEPTFADSTVEVHGDHNGLLWFGMILGTVIALAGIYTAYRIWVAKPGTAARLQERFAGIHTFLSHKWYFDELIDVLVVRPFAWFGRFGQHTVERLFVDGALVGGASGIVRAGSAAVRAAQTGFLRYYAGVILLGVGVVVLYFLLQAS
jgi:NADH-quinone oxidoreductase subunit L